MTTRSTKRHVRAQMRRTGQSYTKQLRELTSQNDPRADHVSASGPLPKPNLLLGARIEVTRRDLPNGEPGLGVILSSITTDRHSPCWRVALIAPLDGCGPGNVVEIDNASWDMSPSPFEIAEAAARGEGRCALGRHLYQDNEVPGDVLATVPELKRMMLRPQPGQPPIATKRKKRGTDELYAIADAELIPARSARDERRRYLSRTCADCGKTAKVPFRESNDGKRYCDAHLAGADERAERQAVLDRHGRAVLWAREIIADPEAVLVGMTWDREVHCCRFRIEAMVGDVLIERLLPYIAAAQLDTRPEDLPSWAHDPESLSWAGKRLIEAPRAQPVAAYTQLLHMAGGAASKAAAFSWPRERDTDNLVSRYRDFAERPGLRQAASPAGGGDGGVNWRRSPRSITDVLGGMREVIREMAHTCLTNDEIRRAKRSARAPRMTAMKRIAAARGEARRQPENDAGLAARLYRGEPSPFGPGHDAH